MRLILLGAPGAGKGTVSELLVKKYSIVQISTGDILRNAVKEGTPVGKKAQVYMKSGDLVPDQVIMDIMEERLGKDDCAHGFIFDGFPRTIEQADGLAVLLDKLGIELDAIVNLDVPGDVIIRRLTSRRTCSNTACQAIYNIHTKPSKKEGTCDRCGSPTMQREDETEMAIAKRLSTYNEKTAPLIDYYKKDTRFISVPCIDAHTTVDAIIRYIEK